MTWQTFSQRGGLAEMRAHTDNDATNRYARKEPNRIVEIHGLMGAIGEQAGLCWTIEQDAQRFRSAKDIGDEHERLVLRAIAESAGHFLLGASHGLGNLGIRLALLDVNAGDALKGKRRRATFEVGTDDRTSWLTLDKAVSTLAAVSRASSNRPLQRISHTLCSLAANDHYKTLDERRGMDYHRLRPQSVAHASPKRGTVTTTATTVSIEFPGSQLDPEADGDLVHHILQAAMEPVRRAMASLRRDTPLAIRAAGYSYHEELRLLEPVRPQSADRLHAS